MLQLSKLILASINQLHRQTSTFTLTTLRQINFQAQWQTGKLPNFEQLHLHELTDSLGGAYSLASPLSLPSVSDHGF
jgi:hypothetical protein